MPELIAAISPEDWAQVPLSVLKLIQELVQRMDRIEQSMSVLQTENELLKEQLAKHQLIHRNHHQIILVLQRIGIALAIYCERELLVLDEATSALDNETESLVIEAIKALSGIKTLIIIAHRLSTVEHCDHIYKVEKSHIVQSKNY